MTPRSRHSGQAQLAQVVQTVADKAMPLLTHTINTKLLGLTPEQSIALMGGGAARRGAERGRRPSGGKADSPARAEARLRHRRTS